jgi:hypothetical protein
VRETDGEEGDGAEESAVRTAVAAMERRTHSTTEMREQEREGCLRTDILFKFSNFSLAHEPECHVADDVILNFGSTSNNICSKSLP